MRPLKEDVHRSSLIDRIEVDEKSDSLNLIKRLAILGPFSRSKKMLSMLSKIMIKG